MGRQLLEREHRVPSIYTVNAVFLQCSLWFGYAIGQWALKLLFCLHRV